MKKFCLLIVLFISLILPSRVFAQTPQIEITSPKENEIIKEDYVVFSFKVKNFTLKDYHLKPPPKNGEGHLHICLDTDKIDTAKKNCYEHIFMNDEIFTDLEAGDHFITAELVGNDHQPAYSPSVRSTVHFKITAEKPLSPKKSPAPIAKNPVKKSSYKIYKIIFITVSSAILILLIVFFFLNKKPPSPKK